MTSKAEIQTLLRFLSQDAKVPLPTAMSKVKELQKANLTSPELLSKTSITTIQSIFPDEKQSKQILNAAKRVSKKRAAGDDTPSPSKRSKSSSSSSIPPDQLSPSALEASLALPSSDAPETFLSSLSIHTNRAPLVLAFAVMLLKYIMPSQPLSSRLSLAQAVVSANSRSKAVSLGLESRKSAEEEGWGMGQPRVKIMGREIRVLKRWGYEWREKEEDNASKPSADAHQQDENDSTQGTLLPSTSPDIEDDPPLWGLDLEALRSSSSSSTSTTAQSSPTKSSSSPSLPIHTPQSARSYLLKSFTSVVTSSSSDPSTSSKPTQSQSQAKEREKSLSLLLHALDLLYASWAGHISAQELDSRSWGWYVNVRPDVADGRAGWGGKGDVRVEGILRLRRKG